MALAKFKIDSALGSSRIEVNGKEVVGARSAQLTLAVGEVPVLDLQLYSEGEVEGEGIVRVDSGVDLREAIVGWLDDLDAAALEDEALSSSGGFGSSETTGESFLRVLKRWAGGDRERT